MAFSKEPNFLKAGRRGESKTLVQRLCDFRPLTSHSLLISIKKEPEGSFYFRFLHTCHAERTKQSVTMPAVTSVMASSWLCVRQRANAVRIARKRSLMVFIIKAPKNSDLGLGSIGSRGSKGLVRRKHNEASQIFDSVSRRRHQKRWREISMEHYGKYHRIGTGREPTPWCYVFLLSHIHRLSDCTGNAD